MDFDFVFWTRVSGIINLLILVTLPFWIRHKGFRTFFKWFFGGALLLVLMIFGLGKLSGRGRPRGLR